MRFGTMGGACGCGPTRGWPPLGLFWFGSDWPRGPERERWIRILEERQRDFEEAAADLADLVRRLRDDADQEHPQRV
jgi:hypothetical protein